MSHKITDKQQKILSYLSNKQACMEIPPTYQEIADDFGISKTQVYHYINKLTRMGLITQKVLPSGQASARTIRVVDWSD